MALIRRGVRLGHLVVTDRPATPAADQPWRWRAAQAIFLPGALAAHRRQLAPAVRATLRMLDRLRQGGSFQDEVARRLGDTRAFRPAGASRDLADGREIEKVYVDGVRGSRRVARDLYAKLSWVAFDPRDQSLRIRFSFGSERLLEWFHDPRRAVWSDQYADAMFPECAAIARNAPLGAVVERLVGRRVRFSERIVYSNAPGGGALFHHDAEPGQLGVVYGQLHGSTAWLAVSKRELAQVVAGLARGAAARRKAGTPARALRALDDDEHPLVHRLLNATPALYGALVARGHAFVLHAGDAILLPSPGPDDVCWHTVFGIGSAPSLAHSYGVFPRRAAAARA